jgi:hypothetical protein
MAAGDPDAVTARVRWASPGLVPVWLDRRRELSEYWIHRQQLLAALGRPPDHRADVLDPVLDGLRWAYPYRLTAVPAEVGETVVIDLPPIFTEKEAQELKAAMAQRRPAVKTRIRTYTLTGLMTSPCGRSYEGHQHRPTEVIYRCKGRHESYAGAEDRCTCPYLEATSIENQVWNDVVKLLSDANRMKTMAQDWLKTTNHKRMDYTKHIAELDQQIAETEDLIDITAAAAAKRALRRGLTRKEAEEAAEKATKPQEDNLAGLEKLRRETEAWQRETAEAGRRLQGLERLAKVAQQNLQGIKPTDKAELLRMMGLRAEVLRCAPRRKGVACAVREWFVTNGRGVPVLTDDAWERMAALMSGPRCTVNRRVMVEALLDKAVSGARYKDLTPKYGVDSKTLQTQAHRWLARGVWGEAMDLLADMESVSAWRPDPVEIRVTFRPLAIESKVGVEEPDGSTPGRRHRTPCVPRSPAGPRPG